MRQKGRTRRSKPKRGAAKVNPRKYKASIKRELEKMALAVDDLIIAPRVPSRQEYEETFDRE